MIVFLLLDIYYILHSCFLCLRTHCAHHHYGFCSSSAFKLGVWLFCMLAVRMFYFCWCVFVFVIIYLDIISRCFSYSFVYVSCANLCLSYCAQHLLLLVYVFASLVFALMYVVLYWLAYVCCLSLFLYYDPQEKDATPSQTNKKQTYLLPAH